MTPMTVLNCIGITYEDQPYTKNHSYTGKLGVEEKNLLSKFEMLPVFHSLI